jgi:hypothetical protein
LQEIKARRISKIYKLVFIMLIFFWFSEAK